MEQIETYKCNNCQALNNKGNTTCTACNEQTTVAMLKSMGKGNVPAGFSWPLYPYSMGIGSSTSNDIVIPSNRLAKKHCRLVFQKGSMFVERTDKENPVYMNGHNVQMGVMQKFNEGASVRLGLDEFKIYYHDLSFIGKNLVTEAEKTQRKVDKKHSTNLVSARLMLMLGYLQELHSSMDIKDLLSNSVDAVLKLTGLDRGYAFITDHSEGQMSLKEIISRKVGGLDFFEKDYTISRTMLNKVLQGDGTVIIEDADNNVQATHSMRDFKIKSLVCLPLKTTNQETKEQTLLGVIYADKMMVTTPLPKHIRTSLQVLCQLIVANMDRCQKYREALDTCKQYNSYISNLADEVLTVSGNLGVIAENMHNTNEVENFQNLNTYISGEREKLNTIINSLVEASDC
jgi:pSer/pThr/pTyr-binding forkhead associated (FHA) protein